MFLVNLTSYYPLKTRIVNIGNVPLGGDYPIRIQSMTNTNTQETQATVSQIINLIKLGCEYIRISTPSLKDAENLINIKKELKRQGFEIPIIADVHFSPKVAEFAARIVEKVRINPGNYYDRKKFTSAKILSALDEYNAEIERIRERLIPLIKICKHYGTALRIGSNHGSLSDRILNRYGNTPLGMVEAVMEFLRICDDLNFYNIVVSVKSANPIVMVHANRLLVEKMKEEGMNYPIHLGVTEAGSGKEGIIKSALGIGTLLDDGIGDTIRVSLTDDPEKEIPIAKIIAERYSKFRVQNSTSSSPHPAPLMMDDWASLTQQYKKRETYSIGNIGADNVPVVINNFYERKINPEVQEINSPDFLFIGNNVFALKYAPQLKLICNYNIWKEISPVKNIFPYFHSLRQYVEAEKKSNEINFISVQLCDATQVVNDKIKLMAEKTKTAVLVLETSDIHRMVELRQFYTELSKCKIPVVIKKTYLATCKTGKSLSSEEFQIYSAIDIGGLLIDGFGDGIWLEIAHSPVLLVQGRDRSSHGEGEQSATGRPFGKVCPDKSVDLEWVTAFSILQATKTRITCNEYISCPTCARTTFNVAHALAKIKEKTSHIKGLKIAIMGCIVNGIGEMGNADYGIVGIGKNLVDIYKKQKVIKKRILADKAINELLQLIEEREQNR